jgi:hypothetical protein
METRIIKLHGQPGWDKTSALLSLLDNTIEARSHRSVFISFNFDELIDGRQQLIAVLDGIDEQTTASLGLDSGVPAPLLVGAGLSREVAPASDLPVGVVSSESGGERPTYLAELRALLRSALRQIDRLISLILSLTRQPDYPVSEFLIERPWFLLHGTHPPRPSERQADLPSGGCAPYWFLPYNIA